MSFFYLYRSIAGSKSVTRSLLNDRLRREPLKGLTIDIGGGKDATYLPSMPKAADVVFSTFDVKAGATINFETDPLPAETGMYDTVLFLNVLEHIFNHQHLANEVVRIVKPGGKVIGFVPFLMWYHPDHHDYFRYTHEALEKIFTNAGATKVEVEPIAYGPFTAAAQMITQSFPSILAPVVFTLFYAMDSVYLWLRPKRGRNFALGYFFVLYK
jgi:SAM-dependent methyltransferase